MQEEKIVKQTLIQIDNINPMQDEVSIVPISMKKGHIQINNELHCYIIKKNQIRILTTGNPIYKKFKENWHVEKIKRFKDFMIIYAAENIKGNRRDRRFRRNDYRGESEIYIFHRDLYKGQITTSNNPNYNVFFGNRHQSIGLTHFIQSKREPILAIDLIDKNNSGEVMLHRIGELSDIEGLRWYFKFGEYGILMLTRDRILAFMRGMNRMTARFEPKLKSVSHIFGLMEDDYEFYEAVKSVDDNFVVVIQKKKRGIKQKDPLSKSHFFQQNDNNQFIGQSEKTIKSKRGNASNKPKYVISILDLKNIFMVKLKDTSLEKDIRILGDILKVSFLTLQKFGYLLILLVLKSDGFYFEILKIRPNGYFADERFSYKIFPNLPKRLGHLQKEFESKKMEDRYVMKCFKGVFEFDSCSYLGQFGITNQSGGFVVKPVVIKIEFNPYDVFSLRESSVLKNKESDDKLKRMSSRSKIDAFSPSFMFARGQSIRDSEALSQLQEDISQSVFKSKLSFVDRTVPTVINESDNGTRQKNFEMMRQKSMAVRGGKSKERRLSGFVRLDQKNKNKRANRILMRHNGDDFIDPGLSENSSRTILDGQEGQLNKPLSSNRGEEKSCCASCSLI